jgi:Cu/Ag efflux pump CusA
MTFNPGISLAESNRIGLIAEKLLLEVPGVAAVGRRTMLTVNEPSLNGGRNARGSCQAATPAPSTATATIPTRITLTPVLASWLLPGLKNLEEHDSRFLKLLKRGNAALLRGAFRHLARIEMM